VSEMKKMHRRDHQLTSAIGANRNVAAFKVKRKTIKNHLRQNRKIRKSLKPIYKPDLDAIMEEALNKG